MAAPVITDTVLASAAGTNTVTTGSLVSGGSNRVIYVFVGNSDGTPKAVSSVTWNVASPQSLTKIYDSGTAFFQLVEVWRLIAPTAATDDITVTLASSTTALIVIAVAVEDIDQTTPNGTIVGDADTGSGDSSLAVSSASGKLALDYIYRFSTLLSVGAGQTELENAFETEARAAVSTEAGASTNTFTWGDGGGGTVSNWEWTAVAMSLNEVSGGGSSSLTVENASLTGTGQSVAFDANVVVEQSTVALTGQTLTFVESTGIAVNEGTITLAGQDISLLANENFVLPVTNATLTNEGQELPFILDVPWDEVLLTLTGQDITLVAGVPVILAVTEATFGFTGQTVNFILDEDFAIAVDNATATLTGQDVTLSALTSFVLAVDMSSLVLSTQNVGLFTPYNTSSGAGGRRCRDRAIPRMMTGR
jgi:hypothetical protein